MAGHSHWAGIKHKKAANDAKRGKIWSKLARVIIVAARAGGPDPAANLSLRYAIDKAKQANMPKDTIEKAIKKGCGETGGANYEEVLYEGYGPNGVAVMVQALTDNRNRTGPELKKLFERAGGSLGTSNCVAWMFDKKGLIAVNTSAAQEDELMELALGAGADDMTNEGEVFEITCDPAAFDELKKALDENEIPTEVADISMVPQNTVAVTDVDTAQKIMKLMDAFDDHEDIQNAFGNFDIPNDIMEQLG